MLNYEIPFPISKEDLQRLKEEMGLDIPNEVILEGIGKALSSNRDKILLDALIIARDNKTDREPFAIQEDEELGPGYYVCWLDDGDDIIERHGPYPTYTIAYSDAANQGGVHHPESDHEY
jgi:hypothetical protein